MDAWGGKIRELLLKPWVSPLSGELLQRQDLILLGDHPPLAQTLEALFVRDQEQSIGLFHFHFPTVEAFLAALPLLHLVEKNFTGYRLGEFLYPPTARDLDNAYAAGIELVDFPAVNLYDTSPRAWLGPARALFPAWGIATSFTINAAPPAELHAGIEHLLELGLLPLPRLAPAAACHAEATLVEFYQELVAQWRRHRVCLTPILPLLLASTPLDLRPRPGIDRLVAQATGAGRRAAFDLRRLLRVQAVESSFASAGL